MPATPIANPVSGESLVGTEPQLSQQVDPGWRHRLNLFTGRALTDTALDGEQLYRSGLLATLGQSVTAGTVKGLALTIDASGADPLLAITPGYGITASGADVVLLRALKTNLSTLAVIDAVTGNEQLTFHQFVGNPANTTYAGILVLQPIVAQVSGQTLDTGTGPIEVSGNLGASCDQDPAEYAFEDWQIADGARLVFFPWPAGVPALPLPDRNPEATWRNRLAYAIFQAESLLGPDDQLPWAMLGLPVALVAFDPGVAWKASTAFTAGQFITDPNGNTQQVKTAGTSAATQPATWNTAFGGTTTDGGVTWINNGLAWKPLFVDCSAVVRAGGLPRRRCVLPAQPPPLRRWQSTAPFKVGDFIVDVNNNVQKVLTAGTSGGPPPVWSTGFGQTTTDGTVTWENFGTGSWKPNTLFAVGQLVFDSNGNIQAVQTSGTSGSTEPQWNGIYLATADGTVTWVNSGKGNSPIIQPALAQARIAQLSEQLGQTMSQQLKFSTLADIFPTLPPSGILPSTALDFVNKKAPWFPLNWSISAAPVHLEELESVLETSMTEALIEAQTSALADPTLVEPVEVLVPLPDAVYDPNILVTETVAPVFQQEIDKATQARNSTLQRIKTVEGELNTLFAALGPNVPVNPNVIDLNAGLTSQEVQGRNTPPPYMPASREAFGTLLQSTWLPSTAYAGGQFVIDGNGAIQVVQVAGTSGAASPSWNTNIRQTTSDGTGTPALTWLNNGPWTWQPNTPYIPGQFVVDPNGIMQVVKVGGVSAASQPNWNKTFPTPPPPEKDIFDGITWQSGGNAQWQPDNVYAAGQLILDSSGSIQIVQTGGISGDLAPAWSKSPGQTTQDGGVIWNNLGRSLWQPNTSFSAGQAIVDSNQEIQLVQIGGTSSASQPAWTEGSTAAGPSTTLEASVTWVNRGPLTWQPARAYAKGQIVIDSSGNLQLVQTAGTSGSAPPAWNTTPAGTTSAGIVSNGTTSDGTITWMYLAFSSTDLSQVKTAANQAPYVITYQDGQGASHTINLISPDDLTDLQNNGLEHLITRLNARISQANDLLDRAFLTVQTDIYRYRQNVLGSNAATALATSPVLANIATGETATATATNLQSYINTVIPPAGTTTPAPSYNKPIFNPVKIPVVTAGNAVAPRLAAPATTAAPAAALRTQSVASTLAASTLARASTGGAAINQSTLLPRATTGAPAINLGTLTGPGTSQLSRTGLANIQAGSAAAQLRFTSGETPVFAGAALVGPAQIVIPGQNAAATPTDITSQSPIAGAQANVRTLTIAQRLQISPSMEAMFYSIGNRLSFLQVLEMLASPAIGIVVDDLQILVDGPAPASTPTAPAAVPVETHTFSDWLGPNTRPALLAKIQNPYLIADSVEATVFSVGVRVVEQHTMLLRALEARVQQYADFVSLCTAALNAIQNDVQQAQVLNGRLQNNLLQDRQNVAFTTALLNDEIQRVNGVNNQRQQILRDSVQLVAYTRARTLAPIDTTPSRQLVPASITSPVPACLQQSVSIPPELREIISLLREAPVSWLPSIASLVNRLERPVLLQQIALSTQARAALQLQLPLLPSSAAGEPGVYAPAISGVYSANQQIFRNLQAQRASIQPAALANLSWTLQVATVQSIAAVNDLISAEAAHTEVSNATSRLIQQISGVATCLYTRASIALPIERLAWAEYLRGAGVSVQLQSLAILPNWTQQAYIDRQQMQLLVDWLFQQIDTSNGSAMAFMSDVVRTAILLASDVPIDSIIPGNILVRTQPTVGGVVSLGLPSDRVSSGMYVQLYSGANLAARAVVSDLDARTVSATVTDVFTPGVHLETSDTAHFTAQTPQAVALRPFLMQS